MHKYRLVAKKGEGTFSEVLKAQSIKNGKYVAIKCMKNHFDSLEQVSNLREIQALRRLSPHQSIIKLLEVLYDQRTGRLALVFELMDMNIYELIRGRRHYLAEYRVKQYMYQLMKAMDHMHKNGIFHRDIKPENILIMDDCLKLADFGSCRGIYSKAPYTEYISTRWYRAPECLLTDGYYNYKMDMWGVGCVFFEIISLFPLFPGVNELDQISKIHSVLGTPPSDLLAKFKQRSAQTDFNFPQQQGTGIAKLLPHVAPDCIDLISRLLTYNPDERYSARQALKHPYFKDLRDSEKKVQKQGTLLAESSSTSVVPMGPTLESQNSSSTFRAKPSDQQRTNNLILDENSLPRTELPSILTGGRPQGTTSPNKESCSQTLRKEDSSRNVDHEHDKTTDTTATHLPGLHQINAGQQNGEGELIENQPSGQLPLVTGLSVASKGLLSTKRHQQNNMNANAVERRNTQKRQPMQQHAMLVQQAGNGRYKQSLQGVQHKGKTQRSKYTSPYSKRVLQVFRE